MANWLECKEKIFCHKQYLLWVHNGLPISTRQVKWQPSGLELDCCLHMAKHPTVHVVPIDRLVRDYGAMHFHAALACFIATTNEPDLTRAQLEANLHGIHIPFRSVAVWHCIKYICEDPILGRKLTANSIHVWPSTINYRGCTIPGRFDTALVNEGTGGETGVEGEYGTLCMTKLTESCQRIPRWSSLSGFLDLREVLQHHI